jgi:hypothetical protein
MSVFTSAWKNSTPTRRFPMKCDMFFFFSKICQKIHVLWNSWQGQQVVYMYTCSHLWEYLPELFLEWEMFEMKVVEKIKIHILYSKTFSLRKSCPLRDNVEKCDAGREAINYNKIWRMCIAHWISKVTRAHEHAFAHAPGYPHNHARTQECIILIAFPRQQWFHERASVLRYTYIAIKTFVYI